MNGNDPPSPGWTSATITALQGMTYNATNKCFSSGGSDYYLYAGVVSSTQRDQVQWYYDKLANFGANPLGLISQGDYNIIHGGTLNQDNSITYSGSNYRFELQRNTSTNATWAVSVKL